MPLATEGRHFSFGAERLINTSSSTRKRIFTVLLAQRCCSTRNSRCRPLSVRPIGAAKHLPHENQPIRRLAQHVERKITVFRTHPAGSIRVSQVHANDVNGLGRTIMHTIDPAIGLNSLHQTFVEPPAQAPVRDNPRKELRIVLESSQIRRRIDPLRGSLTLGNSKTPTTCRLLRLRRSFGRRLLQRRTPRPTLGQVRPWRRSCRASSTTCTVGSGGNPSASPPKSPVGRAV
jgi:hypothetical protein